MSTHPQWLASKPNAVLPAYQRIAIKGRKHPQIKRIRQLHTAHQRASQGLYWIEGPKLLSRALTFGASVEYIVATEAFLASKEGEDCLDLLSQKAKQTVDIYETSPGIMLALSKSKPTPGCIAVIARSPTKLDGIAADATLLMMADNLINGDNLGMLLRSIEAAGCDGFLLTGETADPFHHRTVRASCGGTFRVPIYREPSVFDTIAHLQQRGFQVVAASANTTQSLASDKVDLTKPTALLVGNEQQGLPIAVQEAADITVSIPMYGMINSLNVSVAASVLMYEAKRQRARAGR